MGKGLERRVRHNPQVTWTYWPSKPQEPESRLGTELGCDTVSDKDSAGSGQAHDSKWTQLQFSLHKSISR